MPEHEFIQGGDEDRLRNFLSQYLFVVNRVPSGSRIVIGELPENSLTRNLPVPDDVEIVGSIVYEPTRLDVLLHSVQDVDTVLRYYEGALTERQWQLVEDYPVQMPGFNDRRVAGRRYCQPDTMAVLTLSLHEADGGTCIRLLVQQSDHPCQSMFQIPHGLKTLIPDLETPDGVKLLPNSAGRRGAGSGGDGQHQYAMTSAGLITDLPVEQVLAAYNEQLEKVNWKHVGSDIGAGTAVSRWEIPHQQERWRACLVLVADPVAEGEYAIWLHAYHQLK